MPRAGGAWQPRGNKAPCRNPAQRSAFSEKKTKTTPAPNPACSDPKKPTGPNQGLTLLPEAGKWDFPAPLGPSLSLITGDLINVFPSRVWLRKFGIWESQGWEEPKADPIPTDRLGLRCPWGKYGDKSMGLSKIHGNTLMYLYNTGI